MMPRFAYSITSEMKKFYSVLKALRMLTLLLGIPVILIEVFNPCLLDFSDLLGNTSILGISSEYFIQVFIVGGELGERIWRLKEVKFHLFSPLMALTIKRVRS